MYFSYGLKPNQSLRYHYKINGNYLSTFYEVRNNAFFGYKLNQLGGNFVEFVDDEIKFSYHKDFELHKTNDFFITNVITGTKYPSEIISYNLKDNSYKNYKLKKSSQISYLKVCQNVKNILTSNLQQLCAITTPRIAYTAGLDSSTIAYLAEHSGINFTAVMLSKYKFKNLPFKNIQYFSLMKVPNFKIDVGPVENIKDGFYQNENNNLITGYFGDNCLLHHSTLYHQSKNLCDKINYELYDQSSPNSVQPFENNNELYDAINYINTQNYFRHWFNDFQIFDPYRDPALVEEVIKLPLADLIKQFATGCIQKDIIKDLNPSWLNNLCRYKNNYEQFV